MIVKFHSINPKAKWPTKAHETDAGFDLYAVNRELDEFGNIIYHTGLEIEIPTGHVGLIFPRSSICKKDIFLTNSVGVIDSGYRGELLLKFKPVQRVDDVYQIYIPTFNSFYEEDERVGQLIVIPIPNIEFQYSDKLSDSDRGKGGYGSTGNK